MKLLVFYVWNYQFHWEKTICFIGIGTSIMLPIQRVTDFNNIMKIGIDLDCHYIHGVLLEGGNIVKSMRKIINDTDTKKIIMGHILTIIDNLMQQDVKGIGISLPSKIDSEKGVILDLKRIPHWKGGRIRDIIFKRFRKPVYIDSDINCLMLGEMHHGSCKERKHLACISFDTNIKTGGIINNQLCVYPKNSTKEIDCLSEFQYSSIKQYPESYKYTIDELEYFARTYPEELNDPKHEVWENIGIITGRLIGILFNNYNPEVIVLAGNLSKFFETVMDSISTYLNIFHRSGKDIISRIIPSNNDNIRALGAAVLIP